MSSKKDKERELRETDRDLRESIDDTLEQTKSSVNRSTNEAMKEVPEFAKAVNEYQQHTIQATKDIADNFLESQKQVIHSLQSAWKPYIENMQNWYFPNWMSPSNAAEGYAIAVSNYADSAIAATRLANNAMFAGMEVWKNTLQQTRDNFMQYTRLNENVARTFGNTARNNTDRSRNREI
ncbi:MAG TPA: hypothetical protein VJS91_01565 [Nitrososphaeraceae archaeon]|nr:hypothetical protein [Nitrososphaeraceae archaeon]